MGTILASEILTRASVVLQDTTNVRWDQTELINALNDGQRDVVLLAPEACTQTVNMMLSAGTRQQLPAGGLRLIAVTRNMGTGSTPGRAIRLVSRTVLDAQRPNWHTEPASNTALHYTFDPRNPKTFYIYPPQPSVPSAVELTYSAMPATVSVGQAIGIEDIYANALLDYVLYRAYLKDAEYTQNADRATLHYKAFLAALGAKESIDSSVEPLPASSRPITAPNG